MARPLRVFLAYIGYQTFFPLALDLIASYARRHPELGDNVEFCIKSYDIGEGSVENVNIYPFSNVIEDIHRFKPDVIGLSTYLWNVHAHARLCRLVKTIDPSIVTVLGGPNMHSANHSEFLMRCYPEIDISVRNEGEVTFTEILKHVWKGDLRSALPSMLGVTFRTDDGMLFSTARRPDIMDMETIVFPYANREYLLHEPNGRIEHNMVMLETFRGCYRKCRFCVWSKQQTRAWKQETVEKELMAIMDMKIDKCYIVDSEFGINKTAFKRFLELIRDYNQGTKFSFFPQIGYLHEDDSLRLIVESGVTLTAFGIQSINEMTLKMSDRTQNLKRFENVMAKLEEHGITFEDTHLILGLPGDTYQSFKDSVNYVLEKTEQRLTVFNFRVLPGTEFWDESHKYGLKWTPESPYYILETDTFPYDQMQHAMEMQQAIHTLLNFGPVLFKILVDLRQVKHTDLLEEMIEKSQVLKSFKKRYGIQENIPGFISLGEVVDSLVELIDICAPQNLLPKVKEQLYELARFEAHLMASRKVPNYSEYTKLEFGEYGEVADFSEQDEIMVQHGFSLREFKHDVSSMFQEKRLLPAKKMRMNIGFARGCAYELDDVTIDLLHLAKSKISLDLLQKKMGQLHGLGKKEFKALVKKELEHLMVMLFRKEPKVEKLEAAWANPSNVAV